VVLLLKDCLLPTAASCDIAAIQPLVESDAIQKIPVAIRKAIDAKYMRNIAAKCCDIADFAGRDNELCLRNCRRLAPKEIARELMNR